MSLDSIITVQIDRTTTQPSQVGFGTPCIVSYFPTSVFSERVKSYSSLTEMEADGFKATDPVYIAASDCWAQNPSPPTIKVGRRVGAPQQSINVYPDAPVVGEVHTVTVVGYADSAFASRALPASPDNETHSLIITTETDEEDIVDAFVLEFGTTNPNLGDWTATKSGTGSSAVLVITANNSTMDGLLFGVTTSERMGVGDATPVPAVTLTTDLDAIQLYDPDWYGLCIDSNGALEIAEAAAWAEANDKQFVCQTQDPLVASTTDAADTTSVAAVLKSNSYERTMLFFHRNNRDYVCAAMLGRALPEDAGSITWAYKQLSSVAAQSLTTTELTNIEAKNANSITTLAGVSVTRFGTASSGEYMDVMRGTDWLSARIQERVYALLIQNDKIPYTDLGINAVKSEILAQLQAGVARDFLSPDPEPTCTVPRASEVSAADKGSRTLNNVTFRATLAGAVHKVAIEGELNL
jgi:hypothetical protein